MTKVEFEQWYRGNVRLMYYVAYERLQNREQAEDAVSEAVLRLYSGLQKWDCQGEDDFRRLAVLVTRNAAIDEPGRFDGLWGRFGGCLGTGHGENGMGASASLHRAVEGGGSDRAFPPGGAWPVREGDGKASGNQAKIRGRAAVPGEKAALAIH